MNFRLIKLRDAYISGMTLFVRFLQIVLTFTWFIQYKLYGIIYTCVLKVEITVKDNLWLCKKDTINKRNKAVWYDFNAERIHVDVCDINFVFAGEGQGFVDWGFFMSPTRWIRVLCSKFGTLSSHFLIFRFNHYKVNRLKFCSLWKSVQTLEEISPLNLFYITTSL